MMKLDIQKFASGTIEFAADGALKGKIEWSSVSNGAVTNNSTVTTKLYAKRTSGSTTGKSWTGKVKVGDNAAHNFSGFSSSKTISTSWVKFAEYTDTINHEQDGSKIVNIAGWVKGPSDTTLENKKSSGNKDVTLDTILRASELKYFETNCGDVQTIEIKKYVASFYDVITIKSNGYTLATWDPCPTSVGTTLLGGLAYDKSKILNAINAAQNLTSLEIECILKTYTDSSKTVQVGTTQSLTNRINYRSQIQFLNSISYALSIGNNGTATITPSFSKWHSNIYTVLEVTGSNFSQTFNGVSSDTSYTLNNTNLFNAMGTATSLSLTCKLKGYTNQNGYNLETKTNNNQTISLPSYNINATVNSYSDQNNSAQPGSMANPLSYFKPNAQTMLRYLSNPKITFKVASSTGYLYGRTINTSGAKEVNNLSHNATIDLTPGTNPASSYTLTATDGRKSGSATRNLTVVPYIIPTVTCNIIRPLPTSTKANVTIVAKYYNDSGSLLTNKKTISNANGSLVFKYKEDGGSEITKTYDNFTKSTSISGSVTTITATLELTGLNPKKAMTYNVVFKDLITYQAKDNGTLPNGQPVISAYRKNGDNFAKVNGSMIIEDKLYLYDSTNLQYVPIEIEVVDTW